MAVWFKVTVRFSHSGEECVDGLDVQAVEEPHSLWTETVAQSNGGCMDALMPPARGLKGEVGVGRGDGLLHDAEGLLGAPWPGWMGEQFL